MVYISFAASRIGVGRCFGCRYLIFVQVAEDDYNQARSQFPEIMAALEQQQKMSQNFVVRLIRSIFCDQPPNRPRVLTIPVSWEKFQLLTRNPLIGVRVQQKKDGTIQFHVGDIGSVTEISNWTTSSGGNIQAA